MATTATSNSESRSIPNVRRLLRNAARATYGTTPFLLQHGWRQRYVERDGCETDAFSEAMPPLEPTTRGSAVQHRDDGCGPIVMRTFDVGIEHPELSAFELMERFRNKPNGFVPRHIAGFYRGDSDVRSMTPGDEFVVELPGPWNGPVRVEAVDATSVLLVTLEGHMEAGHIRFDVKDVEEDRYRFRIRSWARAGDELFHHLHLVVGVAHEAQTAMWVHTCDRAVEISGGDRTGAIGVSSERLSESHRAC